MSAKTSNQNIRLGIFVIGGLVIFLATVFYMGSQNNYFNKTYSVSAVFKNVEGLKQGDNVWLSGVKIGTVKEVNIISDGKVSVRLSLKSKQHEFIKKDAVASIGSDGLIGNKIVVIRPGKANEQIEDGDTLNSFSPTDTQELFNLAKDVGTNTKSITDDLKSITASINDGEGLLGELIRDGKASTDIRETMANIKSTSRRTELMIANLNKTINDLTQSDGLVNKLFMDTSYVSTFEQAIANVEQVTEETKQMSEELQSVVSKMNNDENAVGVLLADTAFATSLKTTMDNTEAASEKLDENMKALRSNFLFRRYFKKKDKDKD